MIHVAYIQSDPLNRIQRGIKKVEVRLSKRRPPAWDVSVGDVILFKVSGGNITTQARVSAAHKFADLTPADVLVLGELCSPLTGSRPDDPYYLSKRGSRFAVLIELADVRLIDFPAEQTPRGDRSAWISNFQPTARPRTENQLATSHSPVATRF